MRKGILIAILTLTLAGCNEKTGSSGPIKVPEPAKVPNVRPVGAPKSVQPLEIKPVQAPSAVTPFEVHSKPGPKPVQPHTARIEPAKPYTPNSGQTPYQPINARQAAAQQLLQQKK